MDTTSHKDSILKSHNDTLSSIKDYIYMDLARGMEYVS